MDVDDSGYSYTVQSSSSHNGHDNGQHNAGNMPSTSEYDGHSHHIQIPSYASSPVSSPQTPFSPRAMAIQQLKRAASVREQRGQNNSNNDNQLMATPSSSHSHSASGSSSGHGHSPTHSPSIGMSPSMSRAPSIKRIGLERSASDAARRLAMAKLTGEKITPPPEYTMPKTPLPAGPLPSLADLQARHEQRLGIASPEPVPSTSSHSPPQGLSRNPSSASTSLSRQLSAASARTGMSHNLSRNPSLARSLAGGAHSPMSGHDNDVTHDGLEDEEAKQRRTDERQEARSNLIRKLSRGRLAGAAAAANIRERNAAAAANAGMQTETADGQADATAASPGAPSGSGLQRRPSLAEMLARAESRNQQRSQMPETPSRGNSVKKQRSSPSPQQQQQSARGQANASPINTPSTSHSYTSHGLASSVGEGPFSLQSELRSPPTAMSSAAFSPPAPSVHAQGNNIASPATPASITSQASALRKAAALKQFEHIPIPPTPSTSASQSTPSNSHFSPNGSASAHESIYSAMSNYRSYRHTMERDRDSAMARMAMEDNFELENAAALETGRASLTSSALPTSNNDVAMGPVTGRARLHEHHPLSDEEGQEELEDDDQSVHSASRRRQYEDDPTLRQQDFIKDGSASPQAQTESMFSPTNKPSEVRSNRHNLPVPQQQQQHHAYLTATPPPNVRKTSDATSASSLSARRSPGSMPQTPVSGSPRSPFAFSPAHDAQAETRNRPNAHKSTDAPFALDNNVLSGQNQPFLRHHQKEPNGDFPVSVVSSRSSHYPEYNTLPVGEHPPMPDLAALPIDLRSVMKDHDAPNMSPATNGNEPPPPPLPEKTGTPSSSEKIRLADRDYATAERARTASPSPSPLLEHRVPYRSPEEPDNAGPTSEYRFPTASSRGRRPDSISSSNEHHEDGLNSMISQLEAMQAAGSSESAPHLSPSPSLNRPFGQRGLDQAKKTLPRQILQQQTFPQAGPGNPHVPAPKHAMPDYQSNPINGLPSQLRHPAPRANGSAELSDTALPSPRQQKEASMPVQHGKRLASGNNANQMARESGNETFVFTSDAPAYHSSASAENDSAPSLARTGTGSSSSGCSANSDGALPVTAAVLPPKQTKEQIMSRLSALLANYKNQPKKPTALEDPPRHLLLHSPVLQVVNSNTVKDRYLFLFDDILVIAKPLIEEDGNGEPLLPNLDTKFLVKSIVELPKLKLTAQTADTGEDPVQKRKHPLLLTFVDRFANDPRKAVGALVAKAGLSNDATTIANLLFRNPELNRSQLGAYLAHKDQKPILKAYCDRFRLAGIRIEDALRVFIGSLRLPNDYTAAEYMLSVFASQWLANNPGTGMTNDGVFATKLVLSMMELNDALHSGIDDEATAAGNLFSFPNSAITVDDFIAAFRLKDPHGALPDEHLTRIYLSIRKDRLQQAADNAIVSGIPEIEIVTHPSRLPNRLTYRTASENISLTIPKVDPKFAIKLVGQDLRFEPPVLTFARSRTATFRVTPTALGSKAMLFIRLGQNAHLYRNLPINKTFSVERAFMNHTFQIAFVNHLGVKRKYLFSLSNAETKYSWVDLLRTRIENSPVEQADTPRPSRLSDAVSLQVLRDALIAPDEPAPVLANKPPLHPVRPGFSTPPNSRGKSAVPGGSALQRSSSFSKTYAHGLGKAESDLAEQRRPSASNTSLLAPLSMRRGSRDDDKAVPQQQQLAHKTGHELVTAVCQNSLLPLVLGFVGAGVEGVDALPRKPVYPQGHQVHATPAQARGTGRFKDL